MAKKRTVIMPDGTKIKNVPETASKADIEAVWALKKQGHSNPTKGERGALKWFRSIPGRVAQGAADPFIEFAKLTNPMYPESMQKDFNEFIERREANLQSPDDSVDWARLGGNVLAGGAGGSVVKSAPTVLGRIGQGAASGAVGGALAPTGTTQGEDFAKQKAAQIVSGLVLGGILTGAVEGGKKVAQAGKYVLRPTTEAGRRKMIGEEALHAAGDKSDEVISALERADEIVPGSKPIAGEAAAKTGASNFSALQRQVESGPKYYERGLQQAEARASQVRSVAGTEASRKAAEQARDAVSEPFYEAAYKVTGRNFKADKTLVELTKNKYWRDAAKTAADMAEAEGWKPKDKPVLFLQYVKFGIDKQLSRTGDTALHSAEKRVLAGFKNKLVRWISDKVPDYKVARENYAAASPKVDQMKAARELEKVLSPAVEDFAEIGKQQAAQFAKTLREPQTVIRKSGVQIAKRLEEILTPEQMQKMNDVAADLARRMQYEVSAKSGVAPGNIPTAQLERVAGRSTLPNALWRPVMIANSVLRSLQKGKDKVLEEEMGAAMLDPKVMAEIMKEARIPAQVQKDVLGIITRSFIAGSTVATQGQNPGAPFSFVMP